jgi:hypothetical protein
LKKIDTDKVLPTPDPAIQDNGKVRVGYISPAFPPVRTTPGNMADSGKVRTGYISPAFPPKR